MKLNRACGQMPFIVFTPWSVHAQGLLKTESLVITIEATNKQIVDVLQPIGLCELFIVTAIVVNIIINIVIKHTIIIMIIIDIINIVIT